MSVPRLLFVPVRRTGLAYALGAVLAEVAIQNDAAVRFHHLGALSPSQVWDRWGGSSFLDPGLYDKSVLEALYTRSVAGATLSLLASPLGPFDEGASRGWTPAAVAEALDAPMVLLLDCRGWGPTIKALVEGLRSRLQHVDLAGLVLCDLRDEEHGETLQRELSFPDVPVVGGFLEGDPLRWDRPAPGVVGIPPRGSYREEMELVERRLDLDLLERLAARRGFLPESVSLRNARGPLVGVASGEGFTLWSRDSLEILRKAGARLARIDLLQDSRLPADLAGLVLAGHLWEEALPKLSQNAELMRDIRIRVSEGMPLVALGGGTTYLLRQVQDSLGRRHELVGLLPASAEIVGQMEEPLFFEVRAEKQSCLLAPGDVVKGWITEDVELIETPITRDFALSLGQQGCEGRLGEGAAGPRLFCSRVFLHFASCEEAVLRFVGQCADYAQERGFGSVQD